MSCHSVLPLRQGYLTAILEHCRNRRDLLQITSSYKGVATVSMGDGAEHCKVPDLGRTLMK